MWQNFFSILAVIAFSVFAIRRFRVARAKRQAAPLEFFGGATGLLADAHIEADLTAGSHLLTGRYRGLPVQVQTVTDTLAVRKLPSLWLMVTIPEPLPLKATFDLMMRPTGPTTFSNFDHLPVTIGRPPDFPEHAVVRTDDPDHLLPAHVVAAHLEALFAPRGKELLISPKGIRMVIQMAEADRARYGVFRQADFGEMALDPALLKDILDRLIALRGDIENWRSTST